MKQRSENRKRKIIQWSVLWFVIVTIALGWKYPFLGYAMPVVMLMGIIGSTIRGRYVCGNLCPRGGFLDRVISRISRKRSIPSNIRGIKVRWVLVAVLMGVMMVQGLKNPTDPRHWGFVFWTMCTVTTAVAIVLGILIHPRTWCAFCPMGTLQNAIGGDKGLLQINGSVCKGCKVCERACAFAIPIVSYKNQGQIADRDCLKCSECTAVCPTNALSWPSDEGMTKHSLLCPSFARGSK